MKATRKAVALASVAVLGITVLAACGSSSDEATPAASSPTAILAPSSATPTPTETSPMVGGDPSTWSPVEVTLDMNGEKVKVVVGQFAIFTDLPANTANKKIVLRASKKGVVDITQQSASATAGFEALAKGRTKIVVWEGKPKGKNATILMTITVKVKKYNPDAPPQ
ncbi:MAG: hypothetical protein ACYC90_12350 [Candidatus Nanopelagicales bacterium]